MTQEKVSPLRERMMEDMRIRGMQEASQKAHIRALKDFTTFLGRSPDTAEPDDLRAYQLHMADTNVTPSTFNARIGALRFFFSMTCDRDEMKKYMQFRTEPRKLPIVLSVEEVSALLASAPGPGLKYRAALSIGYGGEIGRMQICTVPTDGAVPNIVSLACLISSQAKYRVQGSILMVTPPPAALLSRKMLLT